MTTDRESDRMTTNLYREMRLLRQEVGNMGNKLGLYTEAMFFPSLERILREDFGGQDKIFNGD